MKKRAHTARARDARRTSTARAKPAGRPGRGPRPRARTIELPPECTLADAETLKMRLTMVLKSARPVTVDVRAVRRIDTASMQLLAAFARDRRSSGLAVATVGDSPAFDEAVRLLGLAAILKPTAAAAPPP